MEITINNSPIVQSANIWRRNLQGKQKTELFRKIQDIQFNQQKLDNILSKITTINI